ncbi:hypothetical protein LH67_02680 [Xenorhabdus nematophila]|nr:hypothetical protein LH67_02680 [Xenorhabdus nematophila]
MVFQQIILEFLKLIIFHKLGLYLTERGSFDKLQIIHLNLSILSILAVYYSVVILLGSGGGTLD